MHRYYYTYIEHGGEKYYTVCLTPEGKWQYRDGRIYEGDSVCEVSAELSVLPYFIRIKN